MQAKLVWATPDAEKLIAYCARVSNPLNQDNPSVERLIKYLIAHKHWSPFQMVDMCVEIETSRAISAQIIRHQSFSFQEFSQRYAEAQSFEEIELRRQDLKNRQNSIDDIPGDTQHALTRLIEKYRNDGIGLYDLLLREGIAKECARMVLPLSTQTRLYMKGSVRSWIHYLQVRCSEETQKEHRDVANAVADIFKEQFPCVTSALGF